MVQVKLTLAAPIIETTVNNITEALQRIDSQVKMTTRNETELNYELLLLPTATDEQCEAVGALCRSWIDEPNPTALVYQILRTGS